MTSMGRLPCIAAILVCVSACGIGASQSSLLHSHAPTPSATAAARPASNAPPPQSSPSPSPTLRAATLTCRSGDGGTNQVLIGGLYGETLIYDVSDPVRPQRLCRVEGTSAHLTNGTGTLYLDQQSAERTNIVFHRFSDGREVQTGVVPAGTNKAAWLPNGVLAAYSVDVPQPAGVSGRTVQVYQYAQGASSPIFTYRVGAIGCMCRFGLPQPVLAVSPDGRYLVAGWSAGKGSDPLAIYRLTDAERVATLEPSVIGAFWDRIGARLFLTRSGLDLPQVWTPQSGVADLKATGPWSFFPSQSPDSLKIVYTAYSDPTTIQPRVYVYDVNTATSNPLIDKMRTQVLFVKKGWVWYLEEEACEPSACGAPWGTRPTGKVFAMQLSTGTETQVQFAGGENPVMPTSDVNWLSFTPGELWSLPG